MKFLTSALFFLFPFSLVAQDDPCSAIELSCNSDPIMGSFDGLTPDSAYPFSCPFSNSPGEGTIWFTFNSDGAQQLRLFYSDLFDPLQSTHIASIYRGDSCDELVELNDCSRAEYFSAFFPSGTYYVQLRQRFSDPDDNNYSAGIICAEPPSNDTLCNALAVECGQVYSDLLVGSTESLEDGFFTPLEGEGGDVWFKLEADSSVSYDIIGKNNQLIDVFLATDTCDEVSPLLFSAENVSGLVAEGSLYISVRPFNNDPTKLINYQIEVQCNPTIENSFICNATDLEGIEGVIEASIDGAASDLSSCLGNSDNLPSRWYKFSSDVDGELDLDACGFRIDVVNGPCENFQCLGEGGNFCPSNPLKVDIAADLDYFIKVKGTSGEYEFNYSFVEAEFCVDLGFVGNTCDDEDPTTFNDIISDDCECVGEPVPAGALCENAIPLTSNPTIIDNYSNSSWGTFPPFVYSLDDLPPFLDSLESDVVAPACYGANDVVFSFTPPDEGYVDVTVTIDDSNVEPTITILTGCPFTTAHVAKGCGTDNYFEKKLENFQVLADTTYYILIDGDLNLPFFDAALFFDMEVRYKPFCPDQSLIIGAECDDGNPFTINDIITDDCECVGEGLFGIICENPIVIEELPYTAVDDINNFEDSYNLFDFAPFSEDAKIEGYDGRIFNKNEAIYSYTSPQDQLIDVSLSAIGEVTESDNEGLGFLVMTGCPFETTVAAQYFGDNYHRSVKNISVEAGETYYIFVSNSEFFSSEYELNVTEGFYDCPANMADIGEFCDDEDPITIDDRYNDSCECEGTSPPLTQCGEYSSLDAADIPLTTSEVYRDTISISGTSATLTDLNVALQIDSTNLDALFITLTKGLSWIRLSTLPCDNGTTGFGINVLYDDNGSGVNTCDQDTSPAIYGQIRNFEELTSFSGTPLDGDWVLSIQRTSVPSTPSTIDLNLEGWCIIPTIEIQSTCDNAIEISPGQGLTDVPVSVNASNAVVSGLDYCVGSNAERPDSWFYFEAITSNMIVGAKGVNDYDVVLEIYDTCEGNLLQCKNNNTEGKREVTLLSNLIVGQDYYFRVYDAGGDALLSNAFLVSVSALPITSIETGDCTQGEFLLSEQLTAAVPDYEYQITHWVFEFTELEPPFSTFEFESPNGSSPEITLNQVPELETGRNYDVRVKGAIQNGQIFGDYGGACTISVIGSSGISQFENGTIENSTNFSFEMFPNPNDGNEVVVSLKNLTNGQNEAHIRIYDFVGKLVMNHQVIGEGQQMTVQLPLVDLANGVYVVKITVNEKPLTAKRLVIR